jgi:CRISPR-associated protein Csm2
MDDKNDRGSYPRMSSSYGGGQNREYQSKNARISVNDFFNSLSFNSKWITEGADESFVKFADEAGKYMAPQDNKDKQALSKSQIRNVFGEIKRIQLKGFNTPESKSAFMLLKPKVAYAEGRNRTMGLSLFKKIFDEGWIYAKENKITYQNFCNLLEAILAYHKAYGGKD